MITLRLFPILAQQSRSGRTEQEVLYHPGMTVEDILILEGLSGDAATAILAVVNEEQAAFETPLKDGDVVELILAVEGG